MTGNPANRTEEMPTDYPQFVAKIKARIAGAHSRAALAANNDLIRLYWEIGHEILEREQREGWGAKIIDRLAVDLRREPPDMTGFSRSNLHYMRSFAAAWSGGADSNAICPTGCGTIAVGPHPLSARQARRLHHASGYAVQAIDNGWSRNVLQAQIATDLRGCQGNALTSFNHTLPESDSELVRDGRPPYPLTVSQPVPQLYLAKARSRTSALAEELSQ